ncbi:hypothetical protein FOQG_19439 [Fusarium oxysporum f. sp. raphani 54005]|uniref:Uncharacterized protein n=1 Tax=Fusarium oxysporum f. sp. raphani 54005 TaxID=1089458 RepID=X0B227_FUSOX|nr:hypothetical protein FOQG_19439 [Fusarium oxysporum f. sp. raphani 54005]
MLLLTIACPIMHKAISTTLSSCLPLVFFFSWLN